MESPELVDGMVKHEPPCSKLSQMDDLRRIGRRAMEGYAIGWCDNCSLPFCVDELGIRCRTTNGKCEKLYCERVECFLSPDGDRYLCSMCGGYSCEEHGKVCQYPPCQRLLCQACECVCNMCGVSVCFVHQEHLPTDRGPMCMLCVKRYFPKRHKVDVPTQIT